MGVPGRAWQGLRGFWLGGAASGSPGAGRDAGGPPCLVSFGEPAELWASCFFCPAGCFSGRCWAREKGRRSPPQVRPAGHGAPPGIKTRGGGGRDKAGDGPAQRRSAALQSPRLLRAGAPWLPPQSIWGLGERSGGRGGFVFERPARFLIQLPPNLGGGK